MINVVQFQRKRRANGNHSIESIFDGIRELQPKDIEIKKFVFSFQSSGIINRIAIVIQAFLQRQQINHITGDIHFANFLLPKKSNVLTIHDCGVLKRTTGIKHKILKYFWFTLPAKKAQIVTVNSNFTKQDLLTYINIPSHKIVPIYVFVPTIHRRNDKAFNKEKPTILQLGTAINKNIVRTAQALKGINCKLVILGKLNDEITTALLESNIDYENISTSITDEEVAKLYQCCDVVSFASTFEGFGMPIVEANVTGRVVVAGNTASMPEIAGNAAELVNPFDVNDIRNGFLKVIQDDAHREQLIANGFKNAERFNRSEIANQYFSLYRTMI